MRASHWLRTVGGRTILSPTPGMFWEYDPRQFTKSPANSCASPLSVPTPVAPAKLDTTSAVSRLTPRRTSGQLATEGVEGHPVRNMPEGAEAEEVPRATQSVNGAVAQKKVSPDPWGRVSPGSKNTASSDIAPGFGMVVINCVGEHQVKAVLTCRPGMRSPKGEGGEVGTETGMGGVEMCCWGTDGPD